MKPTEFNIKYLYEVAEAMKNEPIPLPDPYLAFTYKAWQIIRYQNIGYDFSDEELNAADKETGYIGNKNGVSCYMLFPWHLTTIRNKTAKMKQKKA